MILTWHWLNRKKQLILCICLLFSTVSRIVYFCYSWLEHIKRWSNITFRSILFWRLYYFPVIATLSLVIYSAMKQFYIPLLFVNSRVFTNFQGLLSRLLLGIYLDIRIPVWLKSFCPFLKYSGHCFQSVFSLFMYVHVFILFQSLVTFLSSVN